MDPAHTSLAGERIRWARLRAGYETASAAATRLGWAPTSYMALERGRRHLDIHRAAELSRFLGCSFAWLVVGEGEPFPSADAAPTPPDQPTPPHRPNRKWRDHLTGALIAEVVHQLADKALGHLWQRAPDRRAA